MLICSLKNPWNITNSNVFRTYTLHQSTKLVPLICKHFRFVASRGVFIWYTPMHYYHDYHNDITECRFVFIYVRVISLFVCKYIPPYFSRWRGYLPLIYGHHDMDGTYQFHSWVEVNSKNCFLHQFGPMSSRKASTQMG